MRQRCSNKKKSSGVCGFFFLKKGGVWRRDRYDPVKRYTILQEKSLQYFHLIIVSLPFKALAGKVRPISDQRVWDTSKKS